MEIFNFLKRYWLGLIFLIFGLGLVVFSQFYDLKLMVVKKRLPASVAPLQNQQALQLKEETQEIPKIDLKDISLENLTQEEERAILAYLRFKQIQEKVIPSGIPEIYGQELNISFDQVQDAINKVAPLDPTYGQQKITLTGADLERYIKIGSSTACEYCCGATTLVFENGEAACGCEHSWMMRGLAAYLIKNHPELSDARILKEINTWKASFFPKQTLTATLAAMEEAGEEGIKELLEEFPEFLPQMVGGC